MACRFRPLSHKEDAWHTLVHVCRRWRDVVFGSPRRLDLRLLCMDRRLMKTLDIWPELPIVIRVDNGRNVQLPSVTNVVSVLKRHDRVCKMSFGNLPTSFLEELAMTSEPFPALIELDLASFQEDTPIFPDSFLGGSVPRLRSLDLWRIPFPGIGKLLLSTRDLVTLSLGSLSHSGYISPGAMVTILSALTRLKSLRLNFHWQTPEFWTHGRSQHSPALTRVILPALTNFDFSGTSEYLEYIVSRIDAPLDCISVTFFNKLVSDIPLLRDFIGRTEILKAPHQADISFSALCANISLFQRKGDVDIKVLNSKTLWYTSDSLLLSLARACSLLLPPLPSLEHLGVYDFRPLPSRRQDEVQNTQWMELLRPFITVKDLVLDELVVFPVASALQGLVGERVTEILPALQNIFLVDFQSSGQVPEGIAKFIAARELYGHPVSVSRQARRQGP